MTQYLSALFCKEIGQYYIATLYLNKMDRTQNKCPGSIMEQAFLPGLLAQIEADKLADAVAAIQPAVGQNRRGPDRAIQNLRTG